MQIAAASNAATTAAASGRIGLAENFDNFLKLLTTQLQSQDPLSPLDATQFTEQLVQFTGVEQAIKTNDVLGQLVALVRADQISPSVTSVPRWRPRARPCASMPTGRRRSAIGSTRPDRGAGRVQSARRRPRWRGHDRTVIARGRQRRPG
jgi:hypothetical protein